MQLVLKLARKIFYSFPEQSNVSRRVQSLSKGGNVRITIVRIDKININTKIWKISNAKSKKLTNYNECIGV